ncbi:hypothetical protein HDU84_007912 [Entophlyctis sp. JEL0112]|nr:hypothetical protein HDU84_007912 [Entophlyctis sp. JEL0112]
MLVTHLVPDLTRSQPGSHQLLVHHQQQQQQQQQQQHVHLAHYWELLSAAPPPPHFPSHAHHQLQGPLTDQSPIMDVQLDLLAQDQQHHQYHQQQQVLQSQVAPAAFFFSQPQDHSPPLLFDQLFEQHAAHSQFQVLQHQQQQQQGLLSPSPDSKQAHSFAAPDSLHSFAPVHSTAVPRYIQHPASITPIIGNTQTQASFNPVLQQSKRKLKAPRFKATESDLEYLLSVFESNPFPNASKRAQIAKRIGISDKQVVVWFQNRRASCKVNGIVAVKPRKGSSDADGGVKAYVSAKSEKMGTLVPLTEGNPFFYAIKE